MLETLFKRCVKKVTDTYDVKITYVKVILILTISGASVAGLFKLSNTTSDIAGALGTEKCGQIPHENGCVINWCFYGMLNEINWKYKGECKHPCTKEAEIVFNESKAGAVEHCLQNLMKKISSHEKYKIPEHKQQDWLKTNEENKIPDVNKENEGHTEHGEL